MNLLTATRQKTARACQRLHRLRYGLGYRPVRDSEAARFGTLIHLGLEAWWNAKKKLSLSPLASALEAMVGEADPFGLAKAEVMMTGYDARWGAAELEVIAIEAEFEAPLVNPATGAKSRTWRLGGKIDAVVRDLADRKFKVVEHKTSSEDITSGSEYWRRLRIDGQVSTYFDGADALGHHVNACIYDVLLKPALRPGKVPLTDAAGEKIVHNEAGVRVTTKDGKKWRQTGDTSLGYVLQTRDETPDEYRARLFEAVAADPDKYFARAEVVRLESELDEARFDSWQLAQQIREAELVQRFPRNPDACVRYGRTCEFFDVCTGAASLDDERLFTRSTNPHPELSGAVPKEEGPNATDTTTTVST